MKKFEIELHKEFEKARKGKIEQKQRDINKWLDDFYFFKAQFSKKSDSPSDELTLKFFKEYNET